MAPDPYDSYFQPGQILFLAEGLLTNTTDLIRWANGIAEKQGLTISKKGDPLQFPSPGQSPSPGASSGPNTPVSKAGSESGVAARSYQVPATEKQRYTLETRPSEFTIVPTEVSGLQGTKPGDKEVQLLKFIWELDNRHTEVSRLRAVSPNWLLSGGASSPGGTGGPGSRPERAEAGYYEFDLSHLHPKILSAIQNGNGGAGVEVAILDTIPFQLKAPFDDQAARNAYEKWKQDTDNNWVRGKSHRLLKTLLPQLQEIVPDPEVNQPSRMYDPNPPGLAQSNDDGHDYEMSDHGLFAAGLIHTLAPRASIRLFEVLNSYGIGDLTAIARGLQQVVNRYRNNEKLIVNMSLTISFPLEQAHITSEDAVGKMLGALILSKKRADWVVKFCNFYNWLCSILERFLGISLPRCQPSWYERQTWAMEGICDSLKQLGSKVIAAAGNRSKGRNQRAQAEYPAAFADILGVGAMPDREPPTDPNERLQTATYSNLSDIPDGTGMVTLGGEAGPGKGVLGIYLGKLPGPKGTLPAQATPSENGWAWWAGTSFATPIVTGIVAAILNSGAFGTTPGMVVHNLYEYPNYRTEQNEEVLFVRQCPPSTTPPAKTPPHHTP